MGNLTEPGWGTASVHIFNLRGFPSESDAEGTRMGASPPLLPPYRPSTLNTRREGKGRKREGTRVTDLHGILFRTLRKTWSAIPSAS